MSDVYEECEIMTLMAKEIVDDICDGVKDRGKCSQIMYRIVTRGEGVERLKELSEDDKKVIEENLRVGFGMRLKTKM